MRAPAWAEPAMVARPLLRAKTERPATFRRIFCFCSLLVPLGKNVAGPAVRIDAVGHVALVAELFVVAVALQAGVLQADGPLFAGGRHIGAVLIAQGLIAPFVEQVHVLGAHELDGFHAFLFILGQDDGRSL